MMRRLPAKAAQTAIVLVLASFVVFAIGALLPGDPTITVLGENAPADQRAALRETMGLDDPLVLRYLRWASGALTGDLGMSLRSGEPVAQMLAERLPVTLQLATLSMLLALVIGLPLGILAALRRGTATDLGLAIVGLTGLALPYFWLGILLILVFSVQLRWLPPSGHVDFFADPLANIRLMILPTITIGTAMAALVLRQTRTAMLEALGQDYVRSARAKGLTEWRVVLKHALRNALNPVVTVTGLQFGALMGGAVVTETIFAIPGIGRMVVEGVFNRDLVVVQGAILTIVLSVVVINLLTDAVYARLDPRIRM
jgi:peptide/nickel transport system permease protein